MKQKYIVTIHGEITIEGIELEAEVFGGDDLAEQAARKWLAGLVNQSPQLANRVVIQNEEIEDFEIIDTAL